jgi:hypothetical protein
VCSESLTEVQLLNGIALENHDSDVQNEDYLKSSREFAFKARLQ